MCKLLKTKIPGDVLKLVTGSGAAQLFVVISMPVLSRIYAPGDFGILGVFMSTVTISAVFVTGRYETAIPIPDADRDAWGLLKLTLYLSFFTQILIYLVLLFWRPGVLQSLSYLKWLIPVGIFIMVVITTTEFWLNRKGQFALVAGSRVAGAVVLSLSQILFGIKGFGMKGLLLGFILGLMSTAAINMWKSLKIKPPGPVSVVELAKSYMRFPKYLLAAQVFNTGANHLPALIIGNCLGTAAAGLYTVGYRAMGVLDLVATAVSQIFYPRAARQYNSTGECKDLYRKTVSALSITAMILFPVSFWVLPDLFAFVLGKEWYQAGELARWLFPMFFMRFVISPVSALFYIASRQHLYMYRQVLLFALVLVSLYTGVGHQSVFIAVGLYSLSYVLSYLIDGIVSFNLAKGNKKTQYSGVGSQESE